MTKPITIAIAARGLSGDYSGPRTYIYGLIQALLKLHDPSSLVIYYDHPGMVGTFPQARERSLPSRIRAVWDHLMLPLALRQDSADVVVGPKGTIPFWTPCPATAIIHDLGYFYPHLRAYKVTETMYMRPALRFTARRAQAIFTVSEYTRTDVIRLLSALPEKVHTIYAAPSVEIEKVESKDRLERIRERYQLREPFIFYPASLTPRKNVTGLIHAFQAIQDAIPHHLFITGGRQWRTDNQEERLASRDAPRVHFLGSVPGEDMAGLYTLAEVTAYVSLFEGFGLPIVESFVCGTPVLTSMTTSMPEVAGDAALLVDPYDVRHISLSLLRLIKEKDLREELVRKGTKRAELFTWQRTARLMLEGLPAGREA